MLPVKGNKRRKWGERKLEITSEMGEQKLEITSMELLGFPPLEALYVTYQDSSALSPQHVDEICEPLLDFAKRSDMHKAACVEYATRKGITDSRPWESFASALQNEKPHEDLVHALGDLGGQFTEGGAQQVADEQQSSIGSIVSHEGPNNNSDMVLLTITNNCEGTTEVRTLSDFSITCSESYEVCREYANGPAKTWGTRGWLFLKMPYHEYLFVAGGYHQSPDKALPPFPQWLHDSQLSSHDESAQLGGNHEEEEEEDKQSFDDDEEEEEQEEQSLALGEDEEEEEQSRHRTGPVHSRRNPDGDVEQDSVSSVTASDEGEVVNGSDALKKADEAADNLYRRHSFLSSHEISERGILRFANVSVDLDYLGLHADARELHLLPKAMSSDAVWTFWNYVNRKNKATSSRLAVKFNAGDSKVPRASPKSTRKAARVPLSMLPNVELATCIAHNQNYRLHLYWLGPDRISKNNYLEQDVITVIAAALNKSLKTLPSRSSTLGLPENESFLLGKQAQHASQFDLRDETKDSTQKAFPNRFSNAATTLLLEGMVAQFLEISSQGEFSERQRHFALELYNNATYSLSVAGTKHTMTVETFTRESVRARLEGLKEKDNSWVGWSENRYLRLCLKNAANIEVPKKLRSLFPDLVEARTRGERIPRMYVDTAITFHSKYKGFTLIASSGWKAEDMFKAFVEERPPDDADPPEQSWDSDARDPRWDNWVKPEPELDEMSYEWNEDHPSTMSCGSSAEQQEDEDDSSKSSEEEDDNDPLNAGQEDGSSKSSEDDSSKSSEEEDDDDDPLNGGRHTGTEVGGENDVEQGGGSGSQQSNTSQEDYPSQDGTNEGEIQDAQGRGPAEEDILDQLGTDDLQEGYSPDDDDEDYEDENMLLSMLQVTGESTSGDRQFKLPWTEFVMNFIPLIVNIHSGKVEVKRSETLLQDSDSDSDSEEHGSARFCIHHPENGRAHGGQLYLDGLRTIERRQDTKRWEVLVGLGAAVAAYFREGVPSDEVVQKIRNSLSQLKPAIDDVKKLFRTSQGSGVRMEWFSRCDAVFDSDEETLNFNTPPLVPLCMVDQKALAGMFSAVTDLYFNPLLRAFPDTVLRDTGRAAGTVARLDRNQLSAAAQTTLVLFAEIVASQFANLPFAYNGTVMKSMKGQLLNRNSRYIRVPNYLQSPPSQLEKDVLALPFVVSPKALVLPSLTVAFALFEEDSIPRNASVGVSSSLSMALSRAAFFRGETALPVTYEVRMTVIRKILFVFAYFGTCK